MDPICVPERMSAEGPRRQVAALHIDDTKPEPGTATTEPAVPHHKRGCSKPPPGGRCGQAAGSRSSMVTRRHLQRRRRRYRSRAGPGCRGRGHTASSSADPRARQPPARPAAALRRPLRGGDERVPKRVRRDGLGDPGPAGRLRTIRPAPCQSSRRPSAARNTGPSVCSPMARSSARAVRGATGQNTPFSAGMGSFARLPRRTPDRRLGYGVLRDVRPSCSWRALCGLARASIRSGGGPHRRLPPSVAPGSRRTSSSTHTSTTDPPRR